MTVEKPTFKHGVALGALLGAVTVSILTPRPDIEYVEVMSEPEIRTERVVEIEEKTVEVPVEVQVPLPDACLDAEKLLMQVQNLANSFQFKAKGFNTYLDYLDFRILYDPSAVTKTGFKLTDRIDKMSLNLDKYFEVNAEAQRTVRLCKDQIDN